MPEIIQDFFMSEKYLILNAMCYHYFIHVPNLYIQFKFTSGKPRGFSLSGFNFTGSTFSRFFHIKGVRTPSDFVATWEKEVQPSLDDTTGVMSSVVAADDTVDPLPTPSPVRQSPVHQSPGGCQSLNSTPLRPHNETTGTTRYHYNFYSCIQIKMFYF